MPTYGTTSPWAMDAMTQTRSIVKRMPARCRRTRKVTANLFLEEIIHAGGMPIRADKNSGAGVQPALRVHIFRIYAREEHEFQRDASQGNVGIGYHAGDFICGRACPGGTKWERLCVCHDKPALGQYSDSIPAGE